MSATTVKAGVFSSERTPYRTSWRKSASIARPPFLRVTNPLRNLWMNSSRFFFRLPVSAAQSEKSPNQTRFIRRLRRLNRLTKIRTQKKNSKIPKPETRNHKPETDALFVSKRDHWIHFHCSTSRYNARNRSHAD